MEERRPLFSAVMPVYGAEPFLADAIRALQGQTLRDWELVIVDDASPDRSLEIARGFEAADKRIRVVQHKENRGASAARNTGIDVARGLYLWFPDPDDVYDPTLLEECARALAENPAVITVFGVVEVLLDEHGRVMRECEVALPAARCSTPGEVRSHVLELECSTLYGYSANKAYDADFLASTGVKWESAQVIEDFFFNVRVFQDAPSLNILPSAPYRYHRRTSGSLTGAYLDDYYPLHRRRVAEMRDQLAGWGLLDEDAKASLGSRYARYILSAVERSFDSRSGLDGRSRAEWLESVFSDDLFDELVLRARADGPLLKACLVPLKAKNVPATIALGGLIHKVRLRDGGAYRATVKRGY